MNVHTGFYNEIEKLSVGVGSKLKVIKRALGSVGKVKEADKVTKFLGTISPKALSAPASSMNISGSRGVSASFKKPTGLFKLFKRPKLTDVKMPGVGQRTGGVKGLLGKARKIRNAPKVEASRMRSIRATGDRLRSSLHKARGQRMIQNTPNPVKSPSTSSTVPNLNAPGMGHSKNLADDKVYNAASKPLGRAVGSDLSTPVNPKVTQKTRSAFSKGVRKGAKGAAYVGLGAMAMAPRAGVPKVNY